MPMGTWSKRERKREIDHKQVKDGHLSLYIYLIQKSQTISQSKSQSKP